MRAMASATDGALFASSTSSYRGTPRSLSSTSENISTSASGPADNGTGPNSSSADPNGGARPTGNADVAAHPSDTAPDTPPDGMSVKMMEDARLGPSVRPLIDDLVGDVGKSLWVVMATIGIVLLIACANIANLLLVRTEGRAQELAVRAALGAGRGRLAREMLVESLLLGLLGGVGALGLALEAVTTALSVGSDGSKDS